MTLMIGGRTYAKDTKGVLLVKRTEIDEPMIEPVFHAHRDPASPRRKKAAKRKKISRGNLRGV